MLVDRLQHESAAPGIGLFDLLSLGHWPRQGRPHRNLLLEYLKHARLPGNPGAYSIDFALVGEQRLPTAQ